MMMNFKNAPLLRRCLSGAAAAAAAVCLSSCGGGGSGGSDTSDRPDISPHQLVPVEGDTAVIYIRGVVLRDTGWEIGSSVDDRNPGPADGPPPLDDTETMLTLYFQPNGEFTMDLPFSSFADDAANDATRAAQALTRNIRIENGHWWQTNTSDNTHNMVLGIYFEGTDTVEDPDPARGSATNPMGYIRWEYRGENLSLHLRTRSNAPSMLGMYRFDGAVTSGKMYVKTLRNDVTASYGGGQSTLFFEDVYDFWGQPAIYFPGAAWAPGENDPLDPILE